MQAPFAELQAAVSATLAAVGRRVRADRVTLWDPRWGERRLALIHQWSRPGCAAPVTSLAPEQIPWLMQEMGEGRSVGFRSIAELPREAACERKLFARHGPRSAWFVPLVVGDATLAVLVAGSVRADRAWGGATRALLEGAAVALAAALVRLRAHEASLETDAHLSGVLEAGQDGFLLVHRSGRVQVANGRATAIFLRTRQDLCAARVQDLLAPVQDVPARGRSTIEALLMSDAPVPLVARRGDGSALPVEVTVRELRTPGEPLLCCAVRDVSEDRRAREETLRLRNEIAFMGRTAMLAEMGSGIAHELNQPLTAILSNAETAQRLLPAGPARETDELRETLQDVVNDTRRAADVLGRMREMLRRRDIERVPVDMGALLASVARRFREEAVARSIRISVEVAPALPAVVGDPVQLEQVATNLVLNAVEALGEPGGDAPRTLAIRARPTDPEGIDVSVRDSGPGLDDDALAHAFEAFYTTKPHGLGMGLRISRWIVEAHGGRLLARNNDDRGATFEFHLPSAPYAGASRRRKPA
ncbi:MAG TPA: ATP-binding protein [Anaeromyxobacter sp.]|nr:ATP-binding protein [Anaeromyxobacter sp.]